MMHLQRHGPTSTIAWLILLAALGICYASIFAGLLGLVATRGASLVTFSAAMVGCVAALVYFASACNMFARTEIDTRADSDHVDAYPACRK